MYVRLKKKSMYETIICLKKNYYTLKNNEINNYRRDNFSNY